MKSILLCVESSHARGMGHLLRALNIIELLQKKRKRVVVAVNNDKRSIQLLRKKKIAFETADLKDTRSNWEKKLINKYEIDLWINDRLDTLSRHSENVKNSGVKLVTLDDRGSGSNLADINFGSLPFNIKSKLKGRRVYKGLKYLVLNNEIKGFRRLRNRIGRIVVTFGGSDTYGVTIKVIEILKRINLSADVIVGPCFKHYKELKKIAGNKFAVKFYVPSLIKEFCKYDLAITGGGITPFEANASGLPCVIVASELHEIPNARHLERLGCSIFAGYYKHISERVFDSIARLDNIASMSRKGMKNIPINGLANIFKEIYSL